MKRAGLLVLVLVLAVPAAWGQSRPCTDLLEAGEQPIPLALANNEVEVLTPVGDSLWIGPRQGVYCTPIGENQSELFQVNTLQPALGENTVSAIAARNGTARGNRVWAGLAFDTGGGETGTNGFLVSTDGGTSFTQREPPLDAPTDTTIAYGGATVSAEPIVQQASSTARDIAFGPKGDTVWVAGQRSGVRWTADGGDTWNRTVLPPDDQTTVDPTTPTDVFVAPPLDDGRGSSNHLAFRVLVDETGTVWAGTAGGLNRSTPAGGLNRSTPADVATGGDRAWQRFTADGENSALPGAVVGAIVEQPNPSGRNPIWVATQRGQLQPGGSDQHPGVAVTDDGGASFRQTLLDEFVVDLAVRTDRVYAAAGSGLFVSADQGQSWTFVDRFPLPDPNQILSRDVQLRSVTVTPRALWVGTTEGLLRLDKERESALLSDTPGWELFRTETPVNPETPSEEVPDVSTYAYPNPFVPSRDEFVRIVYELDDPRRVEVNIYDFGMNQIKTLTEQKSAGQQETVWRGTDDRGLRVPTGTYFYTVELGGRTVNGKIIVAN